jgi:hypothetical protein
MKTLCLTVVGMLLAGTLLCHAQVTAYPIKLSRGVITLDQSEITTTISFGKKWIVGDGNRLVLVVDLDNHALRLDSVDADNEYIETLAESTRCAFMANGVFGGNLEFSELTVSNGLFSATGDGDIQVRGQLTTDADGEPFKVSGHWLGVLNDSVDGNIDEPDILIRAKMLPAGHAFDATDLEF